MKSFGIAKILKNELDYLGVENKIIEGYYEGSSKYRYYWNKVKINNVWFNIDLSYSIKYIRSRTVPDTILVLDNMLTFQKEYNNLEKDIISKRMSNERSGDVNRYNVDKKLELEIQKIIEENILKSKYPSKKEKDYITSLTLKMNKKYLNRTYRRYLNLIPYYELSEFIIRDGKTFNNMPYASQELIFNENPHALREILEDEEKYNIMYKNRSKILKFGGYFKSLQDFIKCNNGIRGKLEKLRIDEYGRKIPVIIYIEDEYTWYYYIEEFLNGLDKLYIEKEKIKKLIEDNNKKEDIGIVIEVYKYMMENYIIDKGYNKYLNITNYDELLYNELKESSTSQGICRINKNYGICSALSTIFKELLSTFNIENEIIYGYIIDKEEKFRHQWNSVKICNNLYIIDILIGLEELEKIEKDLEKMEYIHVLNNNNIKYNYGFLLRKRTDWKLYRRRKV